MKTTQKPPLPPSPSIPSNFAFFFNLRFVFKLLSWNDHLIYFRHLIFSFGTERMLSTPSVALVRQHSWLWGWGKQSICVHLHKALILNSTVNIGVCVVVGCWKNVVIISCSVFVISNWKTTLYLFTTKCWCLSLVTSVYPMFIWCGLRIFHFHFVCTTSQSG